MFNVTARKLNLLHNIAFRSYNIIIMCLESMNYNRNVSLSSGKEEVVYATVNHEKRRGRVKAKDTPIKVFNKCVT